MTRKSVPLESIIYLGLFFALVTYDYPSVLQGDSLYSADRGGRTLSPTSPRLLDPLLVEDAFSRRANSPFDIRREGVSGRGEKELYLRDSLETFRQRPPRVYQFNAQLVVLPAPSPRAGPPLIDTTNAAAEAALEDLLMSDIYLQGDLDVDEISAVAGFVSKEDMDVQRLVDVLWSQDIDLGAGRETFEYPIHPPKNVQHEKVEAKVDTFTLASGPSFPYTSTQSVLDHFFVDDETGELTSKSALGNGSRDPFPTTPSTASHFFPQPNTAFLPASNGQNASCSTSAVAVEDEQLQSLIEALNSLNSSTLQAAVSQQGQGQVGKLVEEQWQDVESVISHPDGTSATFPHNLPTYDAAISFGGASSAAFPPSTSGGTQTANNGSVDLNTYDLFSMFMDPPKNWSLPLTNGNGSAYFATPQAEYNSSDVTGYRQNSPVGVVPHDGPVLDMFGMSTRPLASLVHEGPFDLSAFSYAQAPLVPQVSGERATSYSSVPLMDEANRNNSIYSSGWNMSDWHGVGVDMNTFSSHDQHLNNTSPGALSPSSYFANGSGQAGQNMSSSAGGASWKMEDFQPVASNISDAFLLLDDSKLQMLDLDTVNTTEAKLSIVDVKEEEVDPWTEHVNYATEHNHTYAVATTTRRRGRSLESREGSEDDHQSLSGSTGSGSGSQSTGGGQGTHSSRQSRDDRAASELGLPITAEEIIAMPVEEFNGYISGQVAALGNDQIQLMKDIRRRGKNKVAAQNCRRRKIDNMSHLEREIMDLQNELKREQSRHSELSRERERYRAALRGSLLQTSASPSSGTPAAGASASSSVIVMSGGSLHGVRRQDSATSDQSDKPQRKRKRQE